MTAPPRQQRNSGGSNNYRHQVGISGRGRRGSVLLIITAIAFSLFAVRLVDLQVVKGPDLAAAALEQRIKTKSIPAIRGNILDTKGEPLATTVEARDVTADQTLISDPAAVGTALAPILGVDAAVLANRLTGTRRYMYIAKGLSPATWREIEALRLPGIFSEQTQRRLYPGGDLAANVIGFVGADGKGLGGIEYAMQGLLAGKSGTQTYERGAGNRIITTSDITSNHAVQGSNVQLTIDRDIQLVAQRQIARQVVATSSDSGTVIVMDPRSGYILAMATAPTFDSNSAASFDDAVRGNRALSEIYEPGSTSKVMTLAAVVDQGAANAGSAFTIPSGLKRGGKVFHDHDPHGTLHLTLAGIMAKSSNMGTILAAERIGKTKLYDYIKAFGIAEPTGLKFPGESRGRIPDLQDWSPTTFPTVAFGQGLSVNSVQAASVFSTIANDGVRVQPTLMKSIIAPDGTVTPAPAPKTVKVVKASTAKTVRAMLESVVGKGGTAPQAAIPGYRVGGKTGTAQYVDPVCGCYNGGVVASFIGMAPADNPQLVVAVSLVNPKRNGRYGGELGAPVFKRVMTYALQARSIPPTGKTAPRLLLTAG
ncbi:MAG: penicillin-binding protein 2 [Actinobacteria bacterium]|nr:penicillin-binding protein 2 [Actinomycetota bacterium]MSZ41993.1 penicillin-binding protein 2 [Actinomycetota bacterium]